MNNPLHAAILAAHAAGDKVGLIGLYTQAADQSGDQDEACFFLTQAYVFALDVGDAAAEGLQARLHHMGRI